MFVCSFTLNAKIAEDDDVGVERARQTVVVARRQIVCHLDGDEGEEGNICIAFGRSLPKRQEIDQEFSEPCTCSTG